MVVKVFYTYATLAGFLTKTLSLVEQDLKNKQAL